MHNLVRPGQRTAKTGSESEEGCSFAPRPAPGAPGLPREKGTSLAHPQATPGHLSPVQSRPQARRRSGPFEPPRSVAALLSGSCQVTMRHFLTHRYV